MVLNLDVFENIEYEFLYEHQRIMNAVARALKTLEANTYEFGVFLPTLFGLRIKLATFQRKAVYCLPLVEVIQNAFEERFRSVLDIFNANGNSVPAFVAMVSNPYYKLYYMGMKSIPSHILLRLKQMLFDAAMDILQNETGSGSKESQSQGNRLIEIFHL